MYWPNDKTFVLSNTLLCWIPENTEFSGFHKNCIYKELVSCSNNVRGFMCRYKRVKWKYKIKILKDALIKSTDWLFIFGGTSFLESKISCLESRYTRNHTQYFELLYQRFHVPDLKKCIDQNCVKIFKNYKNNKKSSMQVVLEPAICPLFFSLPAGFLYWVVK